MNNKLVAVICSDIGVKIKWKDSDGIVSPEWVPLTVVNVGVLGRTCTERQWIAIGKAIKTPGAWITI